jgi:peptidoglycan/xylan/chitin deacetylase (PgdA/CDA1 family)
VINRIKAKLNREIGKLTSKKKAFFPSNRKVVSFTFDDFPLSSIVNGARIIEEKDIRGTFYAALEFFGQDGFPNRNDLVELLDKGHEVGCHTYSHIHCGEAPIAALESDCSRNAREFYEITGQSLSSFAYPYGEFSPASKKLIGELYTTSRMVQPGINRNTIDLIALYAIPIDMRGGIETVKKWIDELDRNGGWAIFFTHGVCDSPTEFDSTAALFSEAVELCEIAGFEFMTMKEASSLCPIK